MPSEQTQPELTEEEKEQVQIAAQAFATLRRLRDDKGKLEYGEFTFLQNDTIRMALEELADTCNYIEMTAIRLILLNTVLEEEIPQVAEGQFQGTKDVGWGRDG